MTEKYPTIVCLCGSTRFMEAFFAAGWELTLMGQIVLSVGVCEHVGPEGHGGEALGPNVVAKLDELHLRKIDLADWVLVLNVAGYYGESTTKEIKYARKIGKPVVMLTTRPRTDDVPPQVEWETWGEVATRANVATRQQPKEQTDASEHYHD